MKIFFTVTNDLNFDQRMIRICTSLSNAGYEVVLVGRKLNNSLPLSKKLFSQKRIYCFAKKGKLFYIEYNIRLFIYLLFFKMDCICAIDLDTIVPCFFISKIKKIKRIYDAHELFCEMKEISTRKNIYAFWKIIEKYTVPKFPLGYTVNKPIADEFEKMYHVRYEIIRNISLLRNIIPKLSTEKFILYQGAVNEGRCFEMLIPAMKQVNCKLIICGEGNFMNQAKQLVKENALDDKVIFRGKILPEELINITSQAYIGITLFDDEGMSNYYSLANRFFDYLHAGIPQLCNDYPVYKEINEAYPFALLTKDISSENIAGKLNQLLTDDILYKSLQENCIKAREIYNWQLEEKKLIEFYKNIFSKN